ncbi:hypothetical protein A33Q_1133 [Indibacter alkaliphilus LW1]|uniref:DUF4442 domain-containing protein n=1 Tax=Indibacter alkaliphilus (strain CCUG 57479 / KCTC 22604 / LW1) TaxID=1189612 RepID=S2DHL2_INDAL|nr:DUF4442 domain-containing protein [Indibacter alkaliphilus]EOZ98479.1 hypothetical protein A33Q_1133 [Indibacter alkaliphilus LW1]
MNQEAKTYLKRMTNPFIFWWAMFFKLPSAIFWRLRIKSLTLAECTVSIPFFWRSQNPFNSIYFAAMAGAAELSTGALCQLAMAGKGQFSMLVVDFKAEYFKKANQKIAFTCNQGEELNQKIAQLEVGNTDQLTMVSTGTNPKGEVVAKFFVTWSFKKKS